MLIFLHGPDTYRSQRKLKEIVQGYKRTNSEASYIKYWDCSQADFAQLTQAFRDTSLFREKKLHILEDALSNKELQKLLAENIKELDKAQDNIIVFFQEGTPDKRGALYKYLQKNAVSQEFPLLEGEKLKRWIQKEVQQYGLRISSALVGKLALEVGNDLWRLSNEIKKLAAFQYSLAGAAVQKEDIEKLVQPNFATNIFTTIDALAAKDRVRALELIQQHMEKNESPFYLFSMLQFQFRNLLIARDMRERGISEYQASRQLKMHPYVVKKSFQASSRFSKEELKRVHEKMFFLDLNMKTGKIHPETALYLFAAGA